jgi:hypothetical protein
MVRRFAVSTLLAVLALALGSVAASAEPVSPIGPKQAFDAPQKISTDLNLPCGGDGQVVFQPVDGGPYARPAIVRVSFQGQP